jgi:uncharacterized protein (DUF885 family)
VLVFLRPVLLRHLARSPDRCASPVNSQTSEPSRWVRAGIGILAACQFGLAFTTKGTRIVATTPIGALADELAEVLLHGDPFGASFMSIGGYDDAVPDLSPEYQQAWRGRLVDIIARCAGLDADAGDIGSRILLETARDTAARELAWADSRVAEFSVTTFPLGGPSLMLLIASRTSVTDAESATAYLARCRGIPAYLDQHAARLRTAAREGLLPVAPLVSDAIRQLRDHLSHADRDPMLSHRPPEG